jgi:spoIIIJ-associated protein
MADSGQEFTGKTVEEATAEGLAKLGLHTEQADVEVLSRGSRGIFGLGSEPARVRISRRAAAAKKAEPPAPTPKPAAPAAPVATPPAAAAPTTPSPAPETRKRVSNLLDDAESDTDADRRAPVDEEAGDDLPPSLSDDELEAMATEMLAELVQHMGFDARIETSWHEADDNGERYLLLDIHGQDVSPLIGRRGETLAGIQYLVRLMVNQRIKRWRNIVVDVEQYKERRVNQLTQLAKRMADQVTASGRAVSLEPMPANERRIVHLALRDHPTVYTQSSGEGDRRKVHIVARQ